MRIVLATNVLIAALIARGVCAELLEHCVSTHTMVTSDFILGELRGHLIGKFKYTDQDASDAIALLESQVEIVTPALRRVIEPLKGAGALPRNTLSHFGFDQSSICRFGTRENSAVFDETMVRPLARQIAAILRSFGPITQPAVSR